MSSSRKVEKCSRVYRAAFLGLMICMCYLVRVVATELWMRFKYRSHLQYRCFKLDNQEGKNWTESELGLRTKAGSMDYKDEMIKTKRSSWRYYPRLYAPNENGLDYNRFYSYIDNLMDSMSGLLVEPGFNQFLMEACQLLANSLDYAHQGFFDAAFYSVRQAGEIVLTGALFVNLEESERISKYETWVKLDYFPSFARLSKMLKDKDEDYRRLLEQMPEIEDQINGLNAKANKFIHKQGYDSFYIVPHKMIAGKVDRIGREFAEYFKAVVKVCAIFRLTVDPFPILIADPECLYRFPDCATLEFRPMFVRDCLGSDFIERYKSTDFYRNWLEAIKAYFPKLKEATYNVSYLHYIDLSGAEEILDEIDKLSPFEATAVLFTVLFSDKVVAIHMANMLDAFVNSAKHHCGIYLSEMNVFAGQLDGINVPLREISNLVDSDLRESLSSVETVITLFTMGSESVCVETDLALDDGEIELGRKTAQELEHFWNRIETGQGNMLELRKTDAFEHARRKVDEADLCCRQCD